MADIVVEALPDDPAEAYPVLEQQATAVMSGERDRVANTANVAALLGFHLRQVNWVGFYFVRGGELVLGPFSGLPACVRIARGRGVCGTAWAEDRTVRVEDVLAFPGHIACDPASRSEVVVPLRHDGRVVGVLDCDSPRPGRFGPMEAEFMERIAAAVSAACDWPEA